MMDQDRDKQVSEMGTHINRRIFLLFIGGTNNHYST